MFRRDNMWLLLKTYTRETIRKFVAKKLQNLQLETCNNILIKKLLF